MKREPMTGKKSGLAIEELKAMTSQRIARGQLYVKGGIVKSSSSSMLSHSNGNVAYSQATVPTSGSRLTANLPRGPEQSFGKDSSIMTLDPCVIPYRPSSPSDSSLSSTRSTTSNGSYFALSHATSVPIPPPPPNTHLQMHTSNTKSSSSTSSTNTRNHSKSNYSDTQTGSIKNNNINGKKVPAALTISELKALTKQRLEKEQQQKYIEDQQSSYVVNEDLQMRMHTPAVPPTLISHRFYRTHRPSPPASRFNGNGIHEHGNDDYEISGNSSAYTTNDTDSSGSGSFSGGSSEQAQSYATAPKMLSTQTITSQQIPLIPTISLSSQTSDESKSYNGDRCGAFYPQINTTSYAESYLHPTSKFQINHHHDHHQQQQQQQQYQQHQHQQQQQEQSTASSQSIQKRSDKDDDQEYAFTPTMQYQQHQHQQQQQEQSTASSQSIQKRSYKDDDQEYASTPTIQAPLSTLQEQFPTNQEIESYSPSSSSAYSNTNSGILNSTSSSSSSSSLQSNVTASLFNRPTLSVEVPPQIKKQVMEEAIGNKNNENSRGGLGGFMTSKEGGRMFRKSLLGFLESDSELDDSCHSLDYSRHSTFSLDGSRNGLNRFDLDDSIHSITRKLKSKIRVQSEGEDELRRSTHSIGSNGALNSPRRSNGPRIREQSEGEDELRRSTHRLRQQRSSITSSISSGGSSESIKEEKKNHIVPPGFALNSSVFCVIDSDESAKLDPLDMSHHVNR